MIISVFNRLPRAIIPVALVSIALLSACVPRQIELPDDTTAQSGGGGGKGGGQENASQAPVTLRVAMAYPPGALDPALIGSQNPAGRMLRENLYMDLTRLDPLTEVAKSDFAEDWVTSDDGIRWTFSLRDDAMWARYDAELGRSVELRPVTAHDVVTAIWRACRPNTDVPFAERLFVIEGCRDVSYSDPALVDENLMQQTIRAVALDDTTLSIGLDDTTDTATFLSLTTMGLMAPVPQEKLVGEDAQWANASNGPFVLAETLADGALRLVENKSYPMGRRGNVRAVDMTFAGSDQAAFAAFQAGQADVAPLPPGESAPATALWVEPRVTFIAFALDQTPMDDPRVRAALAEGFDRQALVDNVLGGQGIVTAAFAPQGILGTPQDLPEPVFNLQFARDQLRDAGYPNCDIFPRLTLMTDRSAESEALAQALIQAWQANLGCNDTRFELKQDDLRQVLATINTPLQADWQTRPQIYLLTWQSDYPDANNWYGDVLHCQNGYLQLGRACGSLDNLIEDAARNRRLAKRKETYGEAETLLFGPDGLYVVEPLYTHTMHWALQSWVVANDAPPAPESYANWSIEGRDEQP